MNVQLLVIDPQNDFCDPKGNLCVAGAMEDMQRLVAMMNRIGNKLSGINVTIDSHRMIDVAHPCFWVDSQGNHPNPFTIISASDVRNGKWNPTFAGFNKKALAYVEALETNKRYPLCIWPYHCIIGSWGHAIVPAFSDVICKWEMNKFRSINYVTKGSNILTEHYSAVVADVPDPSDPTTQLNWPLLNLLAASDIVILAGEARSHCVANTIRDIANNFGEENIKKMCLLKDCTSDVTGFEQFGKEFINEMIPRGMQISTSTDILS
jgi:nicotinamidase-related amidase